MPNLFPILIEVEEIAVGRVLRKLDGLEGVAHIRLKLREEKRQQLSGPLDDDIEEVRSVAIAPSSPKKLIDGRSVKNMKATQRPVYQAMASVLQHTPAHLAMLNKAVERVGFKKTRTSAYVMRMQKWGWVRRTAPGTYAMTSKGEKAFFGSSTHKKPQVLGPRKALPPQLLKVVNNRSGFRHFLLTALKEERDNDPDQIGLISRTDLVEVIKNAKMSGANLWSTGVNMTREGLINFENGFYSITDKGLEALQPPSDVQEEISHHTNEEGLAANG